MLFFGLTFAAIGPVTGSEVATTVLAAIDMIGGSIIGGHFGSRWHRKRQKSSEQFDSAKPKDDAW